MPEGFVLLVTYKKQAAIYARARKGSSTCSAIYDERKFAIRRLQGLLFYLDITGAALSSVTRKRVDTKFWQISQGRTCPQQVGLISILLGRTNDRPQRSY